MVALGMWAQVAVPQALVRVGSASQRGTRQPPPTANQPASSWGSSACSFQPYVVLHTFLGALCKNFNASTCGYFTQIYVKKKKIKQMSRSICKIGQFASDLSLVEFQTS